MKYKLQRGGIICLFSSWNENKRSSDAMYYLNIETVNLCYLFVTMSRITYTIKYKIARTKTKSGVRQFD